MATMNTLVCSDSGELCRDIFANPNRGSCWCLRCARYSYVSARYPQGDRYPVQYVTTAYINLIDDYGLIVAVDGYRVQCHFKPDDTNTPEYTEVERGTDDYDSTPIDSSTRGGGADLFKLYTGMTVTQALRYVRRRQEKRNLAEVRMFGHVVSMGVL